MFSRLSKNISIGIGSVLIGVVISIPAAHLFGADSPSVAYLKGKTLSPWSIMALSVVGESPALDSLKVVAALKAIDLETPILALTAAGENPRTFGGEDLVAKLKTFYDGTQLGETGVINDDIFGLLALLASGEKNDDSIVVGIKNFILSTQNADGGFSFAVTGTSDTNTTAAAIMTLRALGMASSESPVQQAVLYLKSAQNEDGGFPYDPKSSWGTASDASSDAWVLLAIKALGEDSATWQKSGKTPLMHLETLKQENGSYLYQAGGIEDSFTPVTTSYALLALSGKTLPVRVQSFDVPAEASFSIQVEGKDKFLCDTDGTAKTALDALKKASDACGFSYHLQSSTLGEYVDEIAGEKAFGSAGWLYAVNKKLASVGAGAYTLREGDAVRWYFGNFDGTSAREDVRTEIPLSVSIPQSTSGGDGSVGAEKPVSEERVVSMTVELGKATTETLGFGTASIGKPMTKTIALKNSGAVATTLSTAVSGDAVFRRYLRLNEKTWRDYRVQLSANTSTTTSLSLSIPADYEGSGAKTGALIFWATPIAQ